LRCRQRHNKVSPPLLRACHDGWVSSSAGEQQREPSLSVSSSADEVRHGLSRRAWLAGACGCLLSAAGGAVAGRAGWFGEQRDARVLRGTSTSALRTQTREARARVQPNAIFNVRTKAPVVGLSFDDGPDPDYTPHVLDFLGSRDASATFFSIGVNALAHSELLARQVAEGHTIGNHTYDHAELELLSEAKVKAQIERGATALRRSGAPRPTLFRPPRGFTDEVVGVLADADLYQTVFWTVCLEKFVNHQPIADGVAEMMTHVKPGAIILAHDGGTIEAPRRHTNDRSKTMEALPVLFDALHKRGMRGVGIPELVSFAGY
jgi:peptidoglycan-N-acetylglucosamine deacetylase